jgi:serine/threonine protein kinase
MKAVITDDIPINYGPWMRMSSEGKQLIQQLLVRDPSKRISAAEALQHSWFRRHLRQANVSRQRAPAAAAEPQVLHEVADAAHVNNILPLAPHCTLLTPQAASMMSQ